MTDCYRDVKDNIELKFSELLECKKEAKYYWLGGDWEKCYTSKGWGL